MAGGHHGGVGRDDTNLLLVGVLALGLLVGACVPAQESAAEADPSPVSVGTPSTELVDLATGDPLPFPGYEQDRVTIAPLPRSESDGLVQPLTGWAAFDAEIARATIGGGSDAVSVAVAIGGEIVHEAAMGVRIPDTWEPVQPADRFRIASVSKTITAITVLQLVEEGLVGLDEPVGARIAEAVGVASPNERAAAVTVRQLLTHTSGFAAYDDLFFRHQVETCEQAAAVGFSRSIGGGGFVYSNMNYCVLGLLVELLTGAAYEAVVYDRLLTPLGVSGMRLAPTYDPGPGEVQHRSVPGRNYMEVLGAAGAWVATPADLVAIFGSLDLDTPGFKPLDRDTVAAMSTSASDPTALDRGYGMGLILYGGGAVGHTGTVESTHAMVVDRADNITWAITVNGETPSESVRLARIVDRALVAGGFLPG